MLVHLKVKVTPPPPASCHWYPFIHMGKEREKVEQSFLSKETTCDGPDLAGTTGVVDGVKKVLERQREARNTIAKRETSEGRKKKTKFLFSPLA